MNIEVWHV
ncbi:hypothetical protein F383_09859 [Gossypium arboreum]|uniref:Uncharacterized protein n=1 Tax=Gossypium arboreum TaxID=29729 RepID=A0A0B0P2N9_GOSAR|nr:hypothetical protein F383_09859 [Gossypium arboreum]